MPQQEEALTAVSVDLSLVPGTCMMEERNDTFRKSSGPMVFLRLALNSWSPCFHLSDAGTPGLCQHPEPRGVPFPRVFRPVTATFRAGLFKVFLIPSV